MNKTEKTKILFEQRKVLKNLHTKFFFKNAATILKEQTRCCLNRNYTGHKGTLRLHPKYILTTSCCPSLIDTKGSLQLPDPLSLISSWLVKKPKKHLAHSSQSTRAINLLLEVKLPHKNARAKRLSVPLLMVNCSKLHYHGSFVVI